MEKPDQLDREVDAGRSRGAMARRVPAPTTRTACTQHAPVQNMHKDNLFYTKAGNDPLPTIWQVSFNILNALEKIRHKTASDSSVNLALTKHTC